MADKRAPVRSLDEWMELVTGVLSTGSLPVLFTMRLRVFVKEPARYRIRLEKPIPLTLHNKIPKNHVDTE